MTAKNTKHKKNDSTAKIIADKLLEMAIQNNLHSGDKLPGEIELAEKFGVSRITIREAINGLKFLGILDSAPRRGTTIAVLDYSRLTHYLGFQMSLIPTGRQELLEARIAIEAGVINLIAGKLDNAAYNELLGYAQTYENCIVNDSVLPEILDADLAFHRKLLEIAGNDVLKAFGSLIETFFSLKTENPLGTPEQVRQAATTHRMIVESLKNNNLDLARGLIRNHLVQHKAIA